MNKLVVINVLGPEYYSDCHIIHSINVPLEKLEEYANSLNKETYIVVYCSSYRCSASAKAWKKLTELGFKHVWVYEGGANEWYHLGLPLDGMCKQKYLIDTIEKTEEIRGVKTVSAQELKKMMAEMELDSSCCR